jgi:glutathione S-transferase
MPLEKANGQIAIKITSMLDSIEILLKKNDSQFANGAKMSLADFCIAAVYLDSKL